MQRIPEPELMDEPVQARAYAEEDFSEPNSLFVELFGRHFPDFPGAGLVVDLGCGPGDIALRFARAHPACTVHAVDGAEAMLVHARTAIAAAGLGERVLAVRAALPRHRLPARRYDAVISNSLLHHLAEPAVLWEAVRGHGAPGAPVLVMDLMRPADPPAVDRIVAAYAADAPEVLRRDFRASLCAAFEPAEVRAQLAAAGLGGLAVEVVSDRHLAVHGRLPA